MRGVERQRRVVGPTSGAAVSTGVQLAVEQESRMAIVLWRQRRRGTRVEREMLVGGETVRGRGGGLGWLVASGPGSDGG